MKYLNSFSNLNNEIILKTIEQFGSPIYLYDEQLIIDKCKALKSMPNAYGLTVRYAMKANSNKTVLNIIHDQGLQLDASSLNEVKRAHLAGIDYSDIILTSQEVPDGVEQEELHEMMKAGLKYNVCSLRQLYLVGEFAGSNNISLSIRIHPGVGSGESATRNTGDHYSCFGVHLSDLEKALAYAEEKNAVFDHVHVHIGSGGDPEMWRQNIDLELSFIEKYFPKAETVSFGGGLKEARMPDETSANIQDLGDYAKMRIKEFYDRTGRKLNMEIEPGTYVIANAGYALTKVMDKKSTGEDGFPFIVLDGGMEINTRPLLYASRHPFYVISKEGDLLSSEFDKVERDYEAILVGKCCESGDSQCLDSEGVTVTRKMAEPEIGDVVVIGGAGAYCSSMSPMNYNSHTQIPEVLFACDDSLRLIRKRQTLEQLMENEM